MSDLDACGKGRQFCPQVVNGEFQREAMRHVLGKTLSIIYDSSLKYHVLKWERFCLLSVMFIE